VSRRNENSDVAISKPHWPLNEWWPQRDEVRQTTLVEKINPMRVVSVVQGRTPGEEPLGTSAMCKLRDGFLPPAGAPSWALNHEIFEEELTLATMQRATAGDAGDFAVRSRTRRRLNPNELVHCCAVRTLKLCCRIHSQRMGSGPLKRSGE